ncbi:hypothetical protein [Agrobacterium sp. LAD9]|uniref:hypothetical protein n=1 Tax=Agrobacterium sp. LAD9 TaxID=2055153 RepID=UPI000D1FD183|nr:hypothetical protein [Agrobacterium sp. LAD9]
MSNIPEHLDILSPEDLLAAIQHQKITVTVQGKTFQVRAPTITEICEIFGKYQDLLELLDPARRDDTEADKQDALIYLFRRAPRAVAAFSACALDRPGNAQYEEALLGKPDDFRLALWFAAVETLLREHGTLQSFFMMIASQLQALGLTRVSALLLPILESMLTTLTPETAALPQSPGKRKTAGRKAD